MRLFQIAMFAFGILSFIGSAFDLGPGSGEYLLKAGFAIMLIDIVCIQLWPSATKP